MPQKSTKGIKAAKRHKKRKKAFVRFVAERLTVKGGCGEEEGARHRCVGWVEEEHS